jgi:hypothetical protein
MIICEENEGVLNTTANAITNLVRRAEIQGNSGNPRAKL